MASATTAYQSLQMEDAESHNDGVAAENDDCWRIGVLRVGKNRTGLVTAYSSVLGVLLLCLWLGLLLIQQQQQHSTPNSGAPPLPCDNATWQRIPLPENADIPRTVVLAGQTMALGWPYLPDDSNGSSGNSQTFHGMISAWHLSDDSATWEKWAPDLMGNGAFGSVLALSRDGQALAASDSSAQDLRVYFFQDPKTHCTLCVSETIVTELEYSGQEVPVALSADGKTVAYCLSNSMSVRTLDNSTNQWNPAWADDSLRGDCVVALSGDGTVVAVGDDESGRDQAGTVRVYRNIDNIGRSGWQLMGQILEPHESPYSSFGSTVKLSGNGQILAIAARRWKHSLGLVRIYKFGTQDQQWHRKGQDLVGLRDGGQYGWTMDMASDGNKIVVGAGEDNLAQVFDWDEEQQQWTLSWDFRTKSNVNSVALTAMKGTPLLAIATFDDLGFYVYRN